jgi:hypothetical protein
VGWGLGRQCRRPPIVVWLSLPSERRPLFLYYHSYTFQPYISTTHTHNLNPQQRTSPNISTHPKKNLTYLHSLKTPPNNPKNEITQNHTKKNTVFRELVLFEIFLVQHTLILTNRCARGIRGGHTKYGWEQIVNRNGSLNIGAIGK